MDTIDAKLVGTLREQTGAGIMDCKKALVEAKGNFDEAVSILKKKGVASAAKKADRKASEGIVESYIHLGGRVGVMIELNCETDFVAKNDAFKTLARDIAMHIAALNPPFISREQVPADVLKQEEDIARSQCEGKPAQAIEKIVAGKIDKFFSEQCLLEQPFVKRPEITIKDLITESIAKMGENIVVGRFMRYQIGQ